LRGIDYDRAKLIGGRAHIFVPKRLRGLYRFNTNLALLRRIRSSDPHYAARELAPAALDCYYFADSC